MSNTALKVIANTPARKIEDVEAKISERLESNLTVAREKLQEARDAFQDALDEYTAQMKALFG